MTRTMRFTANSDKVEILNAITEHGYCVIESVLSADQAQDLARRLDTIRMPEETQSIRDLGHHRVLGIAVKDPAFLDPLIQPLVVDMWRRYLGIDMICSSYSANTLLPNSSHMYWHADHPYWTIAPPYPTIPLCGQTIWMLDDFSYDNGATAGIPDSHRNSFLPDLGHSWAQGAEILTAPRGSAIMADGAWWHTSTPNRTDKTRSALLVTYIRSFCVPQENLRAQLEAIKDPSAEIRQLLGANQYQARTTFPY